MTERVDICNQALTWLGEEPIASIDDNLNRAEVLKINYQNARDATLEAHDWSFAIKRFIPAKLATAPEFGPANAFSVPSDIVRVVTCDVTPIGNPSIQAPIGSNEQADWVMEHGAILTNEDQIYCRGIARITEEGRFSPLFTQALAAKLAVYVAINLTASQEIQANMLNLYAAFIHEAKTRDGLQGRSRRMRNRSFAKAR